MPNMYHDKKLKKIINCDSYEKMIEESLIRNPDFFSFSDKINEKIFYNLINKMLMKDKKIQEYTADAKLDILIKESLSVSKIGPKAMSNLLGMKINELTNFINGSLSVFDLGHQNVANIMDFFSIPVKAFKHRLNQFKEVNFNFRQPSYSSTFRLIGGKKERKIKAKPPKNIDNFLMLVKKNLEAKDRLDLL